MLIVHFSKKVFQTACKSPAFFHSNQCLAINNKTIVMFCLTIENCYLVLHNYIVSYLFINNFEPKVLQIFNKNADFSYDVTFLFNTNLSDLILVLTKAQLLLFMIHDWMTNNEKKTGVRQDLLSHKLHKVHCLHNIRTKDCLIGSY